MAAFLINTVRHVHKAGGGGKVDRVLGEAVVVREPLASRAEAEHACLLMGARLAAPWEWAFVRQFLGANLREAVDLPGVWMGGSKNYAGQWVWSDGRKINES